ncbi:uncharacterized protein LOC120331372 isoform X1 [Styela clava]
MHILMFLCSRIGIILSLSSMVRGIEYNVCDDFMTRVIGNQGLIEYEATSSVNLQCKWVIKVPNPGRVKLVLTKISIAATDVKPGECSMQNQSLDIIKKRGTNISTQSVCGHSVENKPNHTFNFTHYDAEEIEIKLNSSSDGLNTKLGFGLEYFVSCDQILRGKRGQFQSVNYGKENIPGLECATSFEVDPGSLVEIYFSEIDVKSTDSSCQQNYVEIIHDGKSERICNKKLPSGKYLINALTDVIKFVTDDSTDEKGEGFVASWVTVPNPDVPSSTEKSKDMTWIGLLMFGIFTLATIFFVMFWARRNQVQIPRTPDSQISGNSVFKFDDEYIRGSIRRCNSEGSSVRASVRGRISKRNNTKWNINESAVARKRASNACNRQLSDRHSTPVHKQNIFIPVDRSMSAEEGYSGGISMSPPPNYDSYFGFYSTRRARVVPSPCLPPRSAGFSDEGIDSPNFNYDRVNFTSRPNSTVFDSQRMWRSTDSIPDRWKPKQTEDARSRIEGKVNDGYEVATTSPNKVKENETKIEQQHISNKVEFDTNPSLTTGEVDSEHKQMNGEDSNRISRQLGLDNLIEVKENTDVEYSEK